jgi:hypothetical protein
MRDLRRNAEGFLQRYPSLGSKKNFEMRWVPPFHCASGSSMMMMTYIDELKFKTMIRTSQGRRGMS